MVGCAHSYIIGRYFRNTTKREMYFTSIVLLIQSLESTV